ncbi:hypothetical protein JGU71_19395 [Antrihabitans sp. YC3-6]|uniref:Uncharacterized protein n=1 Tax=Antrihabitans stalagmiti TaxID=2799499 RepID=A0A934U540_9NOCA|nr:hypothetical protein [Antrihabitans stalagmiti]MBJ8341056.1 hypothetical protein [Antrihabitans stalagmiti]
MTESNDAMYVWQHLKQAASAGELRIEDNVAQEVAAACDELIRGYRNLMLTARGALKVSGLGEIESGQQLAAKFNNKAVGGRDALVDRLRDHIEIVTMIQQTVTTAAAKIQVEEDLLTSHLSSVDPTR